MSSLKLPDLLPLGSEEGGDSNTEELRALFMLWLETQKQLPPQVAEEPAVSAEDPVWRSKCCNREDGTEVSRSCLTYTLTSVISIVVLVFSLYQLGSDTEEDSLTPLWISLVSSIGALHVPSPLQFPTPKK